MVYHHLFFRLGDAEADGTAGSLCVEAGADDFDLACVDSGVVGGVNLCYNAVFLCVCGLQFGNLFTTSGSVCMAT